MPVRSSSAVQVECGLSLRPEEPQRQVSEVKLFYLRAVEAFSLRAHCTSVYKLLVQAEQQSLV